MFGSKTNEGGEEVLHDPGLVDSNISARIVWLVKYMRLRSAGHVIRMSLQNFVLENPWIAPLRRQQITW